MGPSRVVVVDDDVGVLEPTSDVLRSGGFEPEPYRDPAQALAAMRRAPPDLVLLDVMLGSTTGMEVCRQIRHDPVLRGVPVILVTGTQVSDADQVLGFAVGADDYVLKPWRPEVLQARVRAVLRRAQGTPSSGRVSVGPLTLDPGRRQAHLEGRALELTPTEFRILYRLASQPDRAWPRAELLEGEEGDPEGCARRVDVHVLSLRKKLGASRDLIETAYGIGYRIHRAPAAPESAGSAPPGNSSA